MWVDSRNQAQIGFWDYCVNLTAVVSWIWAALLVILPCFGADGVGATSTVSASDLVELSLKDLGMIKVTSVSRKSESLSSAPAAIHVITQDELRRSGASSIAEALRMAPGLQVSQSSMAQWGISARGFNDTFANKLLVLMDGRTIYTPLFSGVFWEETDTMLEDVDRIEVIRGPGATLWGANAVNGVINIITKSARETQGALVTGSGGIETRGIGSVRYGGRISEDAYFRVYGKYRNNDESTLSEGGGAEDSLWMAQGGFRLDWEPVGPNTVTLQGDYYLGEWGGPVLRHSLDPIGMFPSFFRSGRDGGNILARWAHQFSNDSEMSWQASYDRVDHEFGIGGERRDTIDANGQHRFTIGDRQEIVWGGGYRFSGDNITTSEDFSMNDPSVGLQLVNAFVQDEISLSPDRFHVIFGTKLEHNDFTGFEVQPSARFSWRPGGSHTLWTAVSRAVRTPSRVERDVSVFVEPFFPIPPVVLSRAVGNPEFGSEEVISYEIGYRVSPHPRVTIDLATFYNQYDNLRGATRSPLTLELNPIPHLEFPFNPSNDLYGETYGVELFARWQPMDLWRLRFSYTLLEMQLHTRDPVRFLSEDLEEKANPHHQISLWSDMDLGDSVEWGAGLRYVDRLPLLGIDAYTELESRLAWKPNRNCEIAIIGRNLLHAHHREFAPRAISGRNVEVDRAVFGKITVRF